MRLPRTETTLAAVLLLCAAPFALAAPTGANPPDTPGAAAPVTAPPSTTNPGMRSPGATPPGESATQPSTTPGMSGTTRPGTSSPSPATSMSQSQSQGMRGSSSSGWRGHHLRSAERVPKSDIRAARKARVSLTDAINTAQQQNHGNVVSARFELRQGKPEYLVRTFDRQSQQEWLGHIDAKTGKLIGQGKTIPLKRLGKEDQRELTASANAGTSLAQAVQTAEQQRGGKALAAGLSARHGQVRYRTELVKSNGRTQMAMISPKSGQVSQQYR